MLLFLIFLIFYIFLFNRIQVKNSDKIILDNSLLKSSKFNGRKSLFIYIKILVNYFQMIAIANALQLKWPYQIQVFMKNTSFVGGFSSEIFSFECLLDDFELHPFYMKTGFLLILPFALFLIAFIVLLIIYLKNHKSQVSRFIVVVVCISIFFQPSIVFQIFNNISCTKIDGKHYITKEMTIDCDDENYREWVIFSFFKQMLLINLDL